MQEKLEKGYCYLAFLGFFLTQTINSCLTLFVKKCFLIGLNIFLKDLFGNGSFCNNFSSFVFNNFKWLIDSI